MNPKTAAKWVKAYPIIQKTPDLSVVAKYAEGKHKAALKVLLDAPKKTKIRTPRGVKVKTDQAVKKDLRKELEALCKAIVFTRDCGNPTSREGLCISCCKWSDALQWGHFIPQKESKWLQYDPRNTGAQCGGCNGPKHGNVLKYAEAIDLRDGPGSAKALQDEADAHKGWRVNKENLKDKYRKLVAYAKARGIPYTYSDAEAVGEGQSPEPSPSLPPPPVTQPERTP